MEMKPRIDGVSRLLGKLMMVNEGEKLEDKEIGKILVHPDIKQWLKAYDWVGEPESKFKDILGSLHMERAPEVGQWEQKIEWGLRKAMDDIHHIRYVIKEIENYDWNSTLQKALQYLPERTEIDPDFIITIDGFNGGMFRYGTVFLSVVYFDPSDVKKDAFAHELHHMGADYWWKKDPRIEKDLEDEEKKYLVRLMTYLVEEGLANSYCSPEAIEEVKNGKEEHNKTIRNYEERIDSFFDQLEELLRAILFEDGEMMIPEMFNQFTMDKEGKGLPYGHFLSGRMVMIMESASCVSREEILGLVKEPFQFFELYNKAAEELGTRKVSTEILEKVGEFVRDLKN